MSKTTRWALLLVSCAALGGWSAQADAQTKEKVYRTVTPEQVGALLDDLGIKYTKTEVKNKANDWDFDFNRNKFDIRLTLRDGKMLWIAAYFPKVSLEKINEWNVRAKFTRGVLVTINKKEYSTVENQIDVTGGITDNMIKHFIRHFDEEVDTFDKFRQ